MQNNSRSGNTLVFVLTILAVFGVVAAALATFTLSSQRSNAVQQTQRQAYYTARSAVRAVANKISDGTVSLTALPMTADVSGVYLNNNSKEATVKVAYKKNADGTVDNTTVQVSCTAEYQG